MAGGRGKCCLGGIMKSLGLRKCVYVRTREFETLMLQEEKLYEWMGKFSWVFFPVRNCSSEKEMLVAYLIDKCFGNKFVYLRSFITLVRFLLHQCGVLIVWNSIPELQANEKVYF